MSSNCSFLAMRLEGPLQSWGFDSQYNRRNTGLMPTKSAIAGMCCAALGYARGSEQEKDFLASFMDVCMTAIAMPRTIEKKNKKYELPVRRMQDYHTVQNTRRATGAINNDCVLTHRQYLADAAFGVVLEGSPELLGPIAAAMEDPVWGVWLGRKTCIPTKPVLAGLRENQEDAVRLLIGDESLDSFTRQVEVQNFADGRDSLPDVPVSFASDRRVFAPRRVMTKQVGEKD